MSVSKTILAVDDEADLLLIIKTALFSEGFNVITATNGPDAIALANENPPDLVILDFMMPEMNGLEVLAALRQNAKTELIPAIMLTGLSDRERMKTALESGIEYYMVKPFDFHDLINKVKQALESNLP